MDRERILQRIERHLAEIADLRPVLETVLKMYQEYSRKFGTEPSWGFAKFLYSHPDWRTELDTAHERLEELAYALQTTARLVQASKRDASTIWEELRGLDLGTKTFSAKTLDNLDVVEDCLGRIKARLVSAKQIDQVADSRFDLPPGSSWSDIEVRFTSDERVQIFVRGQSQTLNYVEMGFEDRRKRTDAATAPNESWTFFRVLAMANGTFQRPREGPRKTIRQSEKHIQFIRQRLRSLFGLDGDPIPFDRRDKAYKTLFRTSFPAHDRL